MTAIICHEDQTKFVEVDVFKLIKGFNRVYQTLIFSFTGLLEIFY